MSPGDALRSLSAEAERRGTRLVSAHAMQARLFSVYDAAAAAEVALSLVQDQLTRTLDRRYYEPEEIEAMAAELDAILALETLESETAEMAEGVGPPGGVVRPRQPVGRRPHHSRTLMDWLAVASSVPCCDHRCATPWP